MATRSGKEACGCCHSRNAPQDSRQQQRTFHWLLLSSSVQWFAMMLSITSEYGVWMRVYGDDFGGQARLLSALASAGSVIGFCVNPLLAALADAGNDDELPLISWEDIMAHDSRDSIWVVVDGVVYDMTVRRIL